MSSSLCDKVALVTGGSSGIGLETARELSRNGCHVFLLARDADRLKAALILLEAARLNERQCFGILQADVTDFYQCKKAVSEVADGVAAPQILVNCAGDVEVGVFDATNVASARRMIEVNYLGTVNMVAACLPFMLRKGYGHIVNVSSVYGFLGGYGYSAYCASKFAVRGFSDSLRAELKPLGIGVSIVFPQNTDTPQYHRETVMKPPVVSYIDKTKVMSASTVAKAIVKGIIRKRYLIIPGLEGKLLFWLTGLAGPLTYTLLDGRIKRAMKAVESMKAGD